MTEWTAQTAEWYAEKYGEYATNQLAIDALEIAPDATVLDIGCGTASALRHVSSIVTSGTLIGVDPVPRMVEIARERLVGHPAADRIELHIAHAHGLPAADASIDLVLAFDSYDHWGEHQRDGLSEVRRVLAPGGRFVVVKDASVPQAASAKAEFVDALSYAGFSVDQESAVTGDVPFTMWVSRAA